MQEFIKQVVYCFKQNRSKLYGISLLMLLMENEL